MMKLLGMLFNVCLSEWFVKNCFFLVVFEDGRFIMYSHLSQLDSISRLVKDHKIKSCLVGPKEKVKGYYHLIDTYFCFEQLEMFANWDSKTNKKY